MKLPDFFFDQSWFSLQLDYNDDKFVRIRDFLFTSKVTDYDGFLYNCFVITNYSMLTYLDVVSPKNIYEGIFLPIFLCVSLGETTITRKSH